MKHCMECGARLRNKYLDGEGMVPYCDHCGQYRFPVFNTAVSMIVTNEDQSKIILIKQYGKPHYILVAGYVNKGEDAEDAAVREVKEEMGLDVVRARFNHSHYFAPSNTLMLNFTVVVAGTEPVPNREIDSWKWFSKEEALLQIKKGSLAGAFLKGYLTGTYSFAESDGIDPSELERQKDQNILNLAMAQIAMDKDQEKNIDKCFRMMKDASERGADLILFPVITLNQFFPRYRKEDLTAAFLSMDDEDSYSKLTDDDFRAITGLTGTDSDIVGRFCQECRKNHIMAVPNVYLLEGDRTYDASMLIDREGRIMGCQKMVHLAGDRHFYEKDYFDSSEEGFQVFDTEAGKLGIVVGYDRHFPQSFSEEAQKGARLILVPVAACPDEPLELFEWEIRLQAYKTGTALAMCNRTGREEELAFAGGSFLAAADGSLLVKADLEEGLILAQVDLSGSKGLRYRD